MATVTIGRAYFDALLQRASYQTSGHECELAPDLLSNVTVSKAEYDYLQRCNQEYGLLKKALFRGGLKMDALNTLITAEGEATDDNEVQDERSSEKTFLERKTVPSMPERSYRNDSATQKPHNNNSTTQKSYRSDVSPTLDDAETVSDRFDLPQPRPLHRAYSNDQTESFADNHSEEEPDCRLERGPGDRVPIHAQRTILISNLAERTRHKDIAGVIRGGRVLDIFFRSDRSVVVSFVEGAADYLAHVKRNDTYLHAKRLDFRWADRQFKVSPHVASRIAEGASRNLIVRGVAGKVTEEQIRDHLDHIHNLVVLDVYFQNRDAYILTNSIQNALIARTCMMSRSVYKGARFDWALDECAAPLPQPGVKTRLPSMRVPPLPLPVMNTYAPLDNGSEIESDSQTDAYITAGIRLGRSRWTNTAVA